jgi:hypothetical protein
MLEADLVREFGQIIARRGLELPDGRTLQGFIAGHEIALPESSSLGNTGAADILMVT